MEDLGQLGICRIWDLQNMTLTLNKEGHIDVILSKFKSTDVRDA